MDILSRYTFPPRFGLWRKQAIQTAITQVFGSMFIWIMATTAWSSPAAAQAKSSSTTLLGASAIGATGLPLLKESDKKTVQSVTYAYTPYDDGKSGEILYTAVGKHRFRSSALRNLM